MRGVLGEGACHSGTPLTPPSPSLSPHVTAAAAAPRLTRSASSACRALAWGSCSATSWRGLTVWGGEGGEDGRGELLWQAHCYCCWCPCCCCRRRRVGHGRIGALLLDDGRAAPALQGTAGRGEEGRGGGSSSSHPFPAPPLAPGRSGATSSALRRPRTCSCSRRRTSPSGWAWAALPPMSTSS